MNKSISVLLIILTTGALFYFFLFNPSTSGMLFISCPTKSIFNIDCPLCGGQRFLHYILNLDLINAIKSNLLLLFIFPIISYAYIIKLLKPFNLILPELILSNKAILILIITSFIYAIIRNTDYYNLMISDI